MRRVAIHYAGLFLVSYALAMVCLKPSNTLNTRWRQQLTQALPVTQSVLQQTLPTASTTNTKRTTTTATTHSSATAVQNTGETSELLPLPPVVLNIDYASPLNAFSTLDTVTQSDERPEYRLAAVGALRTLAANGDADGRIRESLRMATADGDPRVATAADAAYQELSSWASR